MTPVCSVKHSQLSLERTFWGSPLLYHAGDFMNREAVIKLTRPQELWPVLPPRQEGRKGPQQPPHPASTLWARSRHQLRHDLHPLYGPRRRPDSERQLVTAAGTLPSSPIPTPFPRSCVHRGGILLRGPAVGRWPAGFNPGCVRP